jgi:hypothetical protein
MCGAEVIIGNERLALMLHRGVRRETTPQHCPQLGSRCQIMRSDEEWNCLEGMLPFQRWKPAVWIVGLVLLGWLLVSSCAVWAICFMPSEKRIDHHGHFQN